MSLAGRSHLDTCSGRGCRIMDFRENLKRIEGRRGYFCPGCYARISKIPDGGRK